ncbi:3-hydroxy-3-methylglutaryl-coenzyme a reductase-like protein [Coniochaeta ligniaria NRRL 30616]|uniref:3-hydroxy-3-methylglutaryl coenzyme A reductase n=1 Tax=Coniochaeta ligniaria NRRL 30616 TaxID=1408157 RepID=A0A1J7J8U9_9PEZI|nr:3-hydroxy-3-methylglutaryl-coenzyme a reductase-like protein [Coniochaeta ligniaria NRRL 30616]
MIAASFLPSRFRGEQPASEAVATPSWINKKITPLLQALSTVTSSHPIQTIVVVALLASSTYIGLLQESIFEVANGVRRAEWSSLVEGSRRLRAGEDTAWKWQAFDDDVPVPAGADNLALLTLVFPESSTDAPQTAPLVQSVPFPENLSITALPPTSNAFTTYSQDSALAFAVPYDQAPQFLTAAQEIPNDIPVQETRETEHGNEKKMWIMKAARVQNNASIAHWIHNAWIEFIDLLKSAETLDIMIMVLGYISMHLTFVSLFLSMRRMGSKFWLATSVLFSSVFAFLFGLIVTTKLGVPISMVLLSEGLPFLVVTIGFEKNIVLTRAVLSHAVEHRRAQTEKSDKDKTAESSTSVIQSAIQRTIKEKGFEIIKDYAIEILILIAGAASGVQGGLQQFCFLAAWILFFDCILLFTFYTAILCIKLEINRIKRHVEMRRALEDDGLSHRVAENVAQSNDWPRAVGKGKPGTTIFGRNLNSTHIPKFKVLMVGGFILVNAVNICTIPFRSTNSLSNISSWAGGLGGVVTPLPVDPFKVASNGLDAILFNARTNGRETVVTVLTPIKYELEYPSIHYDLGRANSAKGKESTFGPLGDYGVAGRIAGGILKSLEDPVLSKWIVVALTMSVALNGYLFNAARWGIKDPNMPDHPINPNDLAEAQKFNDSESATLPLGEYIRPPRNVATPASTDDEGDLRLKQKLRAKGPTPGTPAVQRTSEELETMLKEKRVHELSDEEVVALCVRGKIPGYALEKTLKDFTRAVKIRRAMISRTKATSDLTHTLETSLLPFEPYNWEQVHGACCENVIGFMPLPVGVAGPLVIDGQSYFIPMATTEGVLVASASRGAKAINCGGGAVTVLTGDGMTRGPCVTFETLDRAGAAKSWLDSEKGQQIMKKAFDSTSRFARLQTMKTALAGTNLYIRFKTKTGDAMGMNMISKGVEHALSVMANEAGFDDMNIVSVSGNYCTDKKAAAINWIDGRGKGVVAEAIIPADIVKSVLKSDVDSMVELNINKNLIGSAMAGALGGFNAHAANIVAAVFLATGQDPAQVVESSNCITIMKNLNGALQISVSMPSLEVGTLGGGTILEPQGAMLDILGVRGPHPTDPGANSQRLARIIAAAVLAGELSLCSALAAGHLVKAHMQHNRSAPPTRTTTPAPPSGAMTPVGLAMTSALDKGLNQAALDRARR